jgi:hypothetical protein
LLRAPGDKEFALRRCHENQISRLISSKEIEKTILLNSIGSFGGKIGAKKNPPRDGPGRAVC